MNLSRPARTKLGRAGAALLRAIGQEVDGSEAAYERIGSDPDHGIPLVTLVPR